MIADRVVLVHSPLLGPAAWGSWPEFLRRHGVDPVVLDVVEDDEPPYASRFVAAASRQLAAQHPGPLLLLGYSGAGPLLPQLGYALRAARRPIAGYVFLDAGLPQPGASRLDLVRTEDPELAAGLTAELHAGGSFPHWTADTLAELLPDPADRAIVAGAMRPRTYGFFAETLPHPTSPMVDWPDAPCGYLRTSAAYAQPARVARLRGWPVLEHEATHFAALRDPDGLADALVELCELM